MRARRIRVVAGFVVAGMAFASWAGYALADDVISTSPVTLSYNQSSFTITGGSVAQFHNASTGGIYGGTSHSVLADDNKTLGGHPLFLSDVISGGETTSVKGTQYLTPGDYTFHCAIHGPSMSATLHVDGGTPVARPAMTLAITSTKLAAVQSSGKLKAKLSDTGSDASGVALTASLGKKTLATARGVKVAAGASQPVTMKLSKTGAKALKGLDKATVKLGGTVAFGSAAKTKSTLK
jgi:plastocyanin